MMQSYNLSHQHIPGTSTHVNSLVELLQLRAGNDSSLATYTFLANGENEERSISYKELDRQARAIAGRLQGLGKAGDRALLLYAPGIDFLPAFFGCLYARVIAVPAYPPHRNRNLLRLQAIIEDARPKFILSTSALLSKIRTAMEPMGSAAAIQFVATDQAAEENARDYRQPAFDRETLAFLQYTSGSTGNPKGVMLTHGNLLHNAALVHYAVSHDQGDSYVTWLPVFHDMGFMAGVLQPLYGGLKCIQMSPAAFLENPLRWLRAISNYRATTSGGPNFAYELCIKKISATDRQGLDLRSWTVAFNGAEPVRHNTIERFASEFADCGFRRSVFYPCYGLAEATLMSAGSWKEHDVTVLEIDKKSLESHCIRQKSHGHSDAYKIVACGRNLPDQEIAIVEPSSGQRCSPDEVGEIWIKGPSVAGGYWKRPEESRETFGARIEPNGEGPYLRSGDLGFIRDDQLFITGRCKDLLIIRGQNHYPHDIELTVELCHPDLHPGCGAAFSIDAGGEERLVVVQEAASRADSDLDAVISTIRKNIAETHEISVYAVILIRTGFIQKTSSGKIQRQSCKKAFLAGELEPLAEWREADSRDNTNASTKTQELFRSGRQADAAVWLASEIERRAMASPGSVSFDRPLTAYGLDSVTAVEIAHKLQSNFSLDIRMADLFDENLSLTALIQKIPDRALATARQTSSTLSQYALSPGQRALWFLQQMAPESAAYNISNAVRITSPLREEWVKLAFQMLVERHPSLRTTFVNIAGQPVQNVRSATDVCFKYADASCWPEEELHKSLGHDGRKPFDLEKGPLLRVGLYRMNGGHSVLHLTVHHIVADFWSLVLLLEEFGKIYDSLADGSSPALQTLPCSYSEYVDWQEKQLSGSEGERLWSYWSRQLAGEMPPLSLLADRRREMQRFSGASHPFTLDHQITAKLKQLAADAHATLFMTLLAAFEVLLYRLSGETDFVVGSPSAGRERTEFAGLVGYFVNPLPLRASFRPTQTFSSFLQQTRHTVLETFAHDSYPFPLIVEKLGLERDFKSSPLFQTMFVFHKAQGDCSADFVRLALGEPGARVQIGNLELQSMPLEDRTSQFDLTLVMGETGNGLAGKWQYDTDLYDAATVARWSENFSVILEALVADPDVCINRLPVVPEAEKARLLQAFNDAPDEIQEHELIPVLIQQNAAHASEAPAIRFAAKTVTYGDLEQRARHIASYLRYRGVMPGDRVGICMARSPEMVAAMLAVWKAGAAYVPLDPQYPHERLQFMLHDSGAQIVISEARFRDHLASSPSPIIYLDANTFVNEADSPAHVSAGNTGSQTAYLIYTSGSTGRPKGVMLTHANVVAFASWVRKTFSPEELSGVLATTSICFDLSIFELWATLACGGCIFLEQDILQWSEREKNSRLAGPVSLINTVPSAMLKLLQSGPLPDSVRTVNLAGEALDRSLVSQIFANSSVTRVNNLYGPTETTTYSTWTPVNADDPVTIGRAVDNTRLYVLDTQLQLVPTGVAGELYIAGSGVSCGYWKRPKLTAEKFVADPYSKHPGGRMYATGDLVRWSSNGVLEYLGRRDLQVKIRGYRIELDEIACILNAHEAVLESVVIAGGTKEDKRLGAYAVARPGMSLKEEELRTYLQTRLPRYMVPSHFAIIERLPRTPNGKIDRKSLPEFEHHRPAGARLPSGPTEMKIAEIWQQVLGAREIGAEEDFFAIGGHSLLATQILARVEQHFHVAIPLRVLFESPTISAMANAIQTGIATRTLPKIKSVSRHGATVREKEATVAGFSD